MRGSRLVRPRAAHRLSGPWRRVRRTSLPGKDAFLGAALVGLMAASSQAPVSALPFNWSVVPSPNVNGTVASNELNSVSCVSKVSCVAVGDEARHGRENALAESWNGTKWSVVPSPQPFHRAFYGVSCTSAAACVAVGASFTGPAGDTTELMESWNGTAWSVMPAAAQAGAELRSVSCVSPTDCAAVGDKISATSGQPLTFAESWNGSAWSVVPSPGKGGISSGLLGVSCVSRTVCTAVGGYGLPKAGSAPLTESWNGTRWSIVPSPNRQDSGLLNAVSCTSATSCQAVGRYLSGQAANRALIESWNGTRWSITLAALRKSELDGVSCVLSTYCWAFGRSWNHAGVTRTLAGFWDGTGWSVKSTPNAGGPDNFNNPMAVSCASAGACAAVGNHRSYGNNGLRHTLTLIGTVI